MTAPGTQIGPRNFIPYEMLQDASTASAGPADVYMLAKTLWVLLTDQRWPPPGEQNAQNISISSGQTRPHPRAYLIDGLIERCTKHDPADRPSMMDVAEELRSWLDLDSREPSSAEDTTHQWKRLRNIAAPRLEEAERDVRNRQFIRTAAARMQELFEPLHSEIRRNYPAAEFNARPRLVETYFKLSALTDIEQDDVRATVITGPGWNPIALTIGIGLMIRNDARLHYRALYHLGHTKTMGDVDRWMSDPASAPCASIELDAGLAKLADQVRGAFPTWLAKLNDALDR